MHELHPKFKKFFYFLEIESFFGEPRQCEGPAMNVRRVVSETEPVHIIGRIAVNWFAQLSIFVQTADDEADRSTRVGGDHGSGVADVLELAAACVECFFDVRQVDPETAALRANDALRSQCLSHQFKVRFLEERNCRT